LYEQCFEELTRQVEEGQLRPGERLPSERALAEMLGYSRLTVRRTLLELADQGWLTPAPTRGWEVSHVRFSEPPNTLMSFTELARSRGLKASARLIKLEFRGAVMHEADRLGIAPGAPLAACERVRYMDEQPIAVQQLRIPEIRAPWVRTFDWTRSVHESFAAHRQVPTRSHVYVDVALAQDEDVELLGVEPGRGLLQVSALTTDASGAALCLDDMRYHPDRYRFQAVLERRP
jgi:GntR family transcriptional regulator